ncbi:MAG TPA: hypothetical protein VFS00_12690, partial [Polyangiaceae bacterium]|nr:hypothetical protein [Polyangiaceae bacterium]
LTVAANPSTPPDALAALGRVSSAGPHANLAKSFLRALASNPATPLEALERLSDEVDLFPGAARDPALPPSLIEALVTHPSPAVRAGVAQRQDLPPRFVRRLAADPDPTVRAALARHATDQELLSRLSFASEGLVRRALVDNPHTPPHALERLAHAPVARQRRAARERLAKQRAAAPRP